MNVPWDMAALLGTIVLGTATPKQRVYTNRVTYRSFGGEFGGAQSAVTGPTQYSSADVRLSRWDSYSQPWWFMRWSRIVGRFIQAGTLFTQSFDETLGTPGLSEVLSLLRKKVFAETMSLSEALARKTKTSFAETLNSLTETLATLFTSGSVVGRALYRNVRRRWRGGRRGR